MLEALKYITVSETDPYQNLALEEHLLRTVPPNTVILYLWQNQNTVVIGRNQNAWRECNISRLEQDGAFLARRLSGGGAVFHDLGNLNFTFITQKSYFDLNKQLQVILLALKQWDLIAEISGRNDIHIEGKKFSGNAFYLSQTGCYHHGTILVNVDFSKLNQYLQVSAEKLAAKGVASVQSRVINLVSLNPALNTQNIQPALLQAFGEVYGFTPQPIELSAADKADVLRLREKYASWDWNFGQQFPFSTEWAKRFSWGEIQIRVQVDNGQITEAHVYTDAMAIDFADQLADLLTGCRFQKDALRMACGAVPLESNFTEEMRNEIQNLIETL
ncbi:MAG TPA: lipoate--protein ligase [Bacillota bacterium]|nr:lipoate--protein ligase [Bacillota bacterium]